MLLLLNYKRAHELGNCSKLMVTGVATSKSVADCKPTKIALYESAVIMKMRKQFYAIVLGAVLAAACVSASAQPIASGQDSSAKQDMKNAGQDTKNAAKSAANGTKKGTKKAYSKTKSGTKKAYDKTKDTTKGAVNGAKEGAKQPE